MKPGSFPFVWVILFCGVLCLAFIVFNLTRWGFHRYPPDTRLYVTGGDVNRGKTAFMRYGCGGCHAVSGVRGATGRVGPRLDGLDQQSYIAGQLPNNPDQLTAWIQRPHRISAGSAMPNLGVTPADARDIAAFLYEGP